MGVPLELPMGFQGSQNVSQHITKNNNKEQHKE
jgi:hypothetical protein